jgi:hypothetical protein
VSIESAREYAQGLADTLREDAPEDIGEWLEGILDYDLTYGSDRQLRSVRLLVTFGGPNAWIIFDGRNATVQASWYSDMVEVNVYDAPLSGPVFDYFMDVLAA